MRPVVVASLCVTVLLFFSTAANAQMMYGAVGVGPYGAFAPGAGFGPYGWVWFGRGMGFGGFGPNGGLGYGGFGPGFGAGFGGFGYGPFNYSQQLFQQQSSLTQQIYQQRQVSLINQIGQSQNDLAR